MKQIWGKCPSCQTHFVVSTRQQGSRIACQQCFTNISIPNDQPVYNTFNPTLAEQSKTLKNEFLNECPFCHNICKLPQSIAQEGVLCSHCNNIFIATNDKEEPCVTDYRARAEAYSKYQGHSPKNAGFFKKNKENNQLQGNVIANTWTLFTIVKQSMKGNWLIYFVHMFFLFAIMVGSSYIIQKISMVSPITLIIGSILLLLLQLFIMNGVYSYCYTIYYSNCCVFSQLFVPFTQFRRFLTWNILYIVLLCMWTFFLFIPSGLIFWLKSANPSIFLTISFIICTLLATVIDNMVYIKYTISIFSLMEDNNISPWQAMKKTSKILSGNYKYTISIPIFYFVIVLSFYLFSMFIGMIFSFLTIFLFIIFLLVLLMLFIIYPIVLVAFFDVLKEN
ncbi:MAG: hypothetical protein KBC30_03355 [Planctomycetes bacterium]|nr:hypothetical protein [Planctomycetota bacterium]HRU51187.1 hypothetical protein [Planctomycetota bacterium]